MNERYIPTLDGWRAVAILLVMGDHLVASASGTPSGRTTLPGQLGVNIFFGLSGFLITSRLLAERPISLRRFYIRRAFRILPPALTYLAVLGTLGSFGLIPLYPRELLATRGLPLSDQTPTMEQAGTLDAHFPMSLQSPCRGRQRPPGWHIYLGKEVLTSDIQVC